MSPITALSATAIAYLIVAGQQLLLAIGWWIGAALMRSVRTAALHWGGFALATTVSLVLFVAANHFRDELLRAAGNVCVLLSVILLQRGVRCFFGERSGWTLHAVWLLACLVVSWVGLSAERSAWRIGVISALLALINLGIAWDVLRLAARRLHPRWGWALALPLLVGSAAFLVRALRAAVAPESVAAEVNANTPLNVGAAFMYLAVTLIFQLTLVSLVMSQLVLDARRLARRDPLTGLLNRRAIDDALADEAHRARRLQSPFAVLMIDVDHFKAINDRHGHAAGDRALQHLASLLSSQGRDIDRLARWGGEEFVMLLPATDADAAAAMAERLRERAAAVPVSWDDAPLPLTISVGVAGWRGPDDDVAQVLARADAALYRAKAAGRNRVDASG